MIFHFQFPVCDSITARQIGMAGGGQRFVCAMKKYGNFFYYDGNFSLYMVK